MVCNFSRFTIIKKLVLNERLINHWLVSTHDCIRFRWIFGCPTFYLFFFSVPRHAKSKKKNLRDGKIRLGKNCLMPVCRVFSQQRKASTWQLVDFPFHWCLREAGVAVLVARVSVREKLWNGKFASCRSEWFSTHSHPSPLVVSGERKALRVYELSGFSLFIAFIIPSFMAQTEKFALPIRSIFWPISEVFVWQSTS